MMMSVFFTDEKNTSAQKKLKNPEEIQTDGMTCINTPE